ncbi:MAG: hypothetical protein AAF623_01535 [Planctomycetota bacterium]
MIRHLALAALMLVGVFVTDSSAQLFRFRCRPKCPPVCQPVCPQVCQPQVCQPTYQVAPACPTIAPQAVQPMYGVVPAPVPYRPYSVIPTRDIYSCYAHCEQNCLFVNRCKRFCDCEFFNVACPLGPNFCPFVLDPDQDSMVYPVTGCPNPTASNSCCPTTSSRCIPTVPSCRQRCGCR